MEAAAASATEAITEPVVERIAERATEPIVDARHSDTVAEMSRLAGSRPVVAGGMNRAQAPCHSGVRTNRSPHHVRQRPITNTMNLSKFAGFVVHVMPSGTGPGRRDVRCKRPSGPGLMASEVSADLLSVVQPLEVAVEILVRTDHQ